MATEIAEQKLNEAPEKRLMPPFKDGDFNNVLIQIDELIKTFEELQQSPLTLQSDFIDGIIRDIIKNLKRIRKKLKKYGMN